MSSKKYDSAHTAIASELNKNKTVVTNILRNIKYRTKKLTNCPKKIIAARDGQTII